MAVGPEGTRLPKPADSEGLGLSSELTGFLEGMEGVIDRALRTQPPGETFVYGVHQDVEAAVLEVLVRRYREAGWSEARIKPVLTGAFTLILVP